VVERDLGVRVIDLPGGGAAGGLGAGAVAFLGASLARGVDIVIEAVGLKERLRGADLAFTGEGQCDFQTVKGKTPFGVAKTAKTCGVPVVVIAGALGPGAENLYEYGVQSVFSLTDRPMTRQEAMANAGELLASAAERIMRLLQAGERISGKHP
jgi:glycerate kinase